MDKEIIYSYDLTILRCKGDQSDDELKNPCIQCLFVITQKSDLPRMWCVLYDESPRTCMRKCVGNYRIDQKMLIDSMRRKMVKNNEAFTKWVDNFPKYFEDMQSFTSIGKTNDMMRVTEMISRE